MDKEMYLKIARPQNACLSCGAQIADTGRHASVLLPDQEAESDDSDLPVRQDYCADCWLQLQEKNYFGFWMARREKPKVRKIQNRKQRNATLLSYFDYLYQKQDPDSAQHLFFIAHLLMKYSVFKWLRTETSEEDESVEIVVFRNTASDDEIRIHSVTLTEERVAVIKREIDEFLNNVGEEIAVQG